MTCEKHPNALTISCLCSPPRPDKCAECDFQITKSVDAIAAALDKAEAQADGIIEKSTSVPGVSIADVTVQYSDRWYDAAEAYFRAKWMPSSDGIRYLDEWKHDGKDELCVHGRKKHVCTVEDKDYKCVVCH